jgi:hypothetical protein
MSACKDCEKTLGEGHWEKCTVLKREPGPGVYFQVPTRTWLLQAGGVDVYKVDNDLFCKTCFEKKQSVV